MKKKRFSSAKVAIAFGLTISSLGTFSQNFVIAETSESYQSFTEKEEAYNFVEEAYDQNSAKDGNLTPKILPPDLSDKEGISTQVLPLVARVVINELAKYLTATVIEGIVKSHNRFHVEDVYKVAMPHRNETDYRFYAVTYDTAAKYNLQTDTVYTIDGAVAYMKKSRSNNIWTASSNDAILLAKKLTPNTKPIGPENHWDSKYDDDGTSVTSQKKYYNHYHDGKRSYGYIFYEKSSYFGAGSVPFSLPNVEAF